MADITTKLLDFIDASPSCFHVVDNLKKELVENGYTELDEEKWNWNNKDIR